MPELTWVGKDKVITHHLDVPFRVLERQYSFDESGQHDADNDSENMIIHGDNLEALKSLLPRFEGKVDVIYIDPPYNTGNEGWVYNDNVNDPRIKKWLGEVVGKEGEDLSRHDKWLCMMYPRLRLLHKLLAPTGAIFISIDDNEQANLKLICDEIFGSTCFVANVAVVNNLKGRSDAKYIATAHESLLIYRKSEFITNGIPVPDEYAKEYKLSDHIGRYRLQGLRKRGSGSRREDRPNMYYPFYYNKEMNVLSLEKTSESDIKILPKLSDGSDGRWRWGRDTSLSRLAELEVSWVARRGEFDVFQKDYLPDDGSKTIKPKSFWMGPEFSAETGTLEIKAIFGDRAFDTPKSLGLLTHCLTQASDPNSIVLDSFAGSGTTAHAVLNMNKADGGNRKFILVELGDYANDVTAERVKRVINGYGDGKKAVAGTDGSFSYYELGEQMLINGNLNPKVGLEKIREYIWFTDTGAPYSPVTDFSHPHYLGNIHDTAYFFAYEPDRATLLDREYLAGIPKECAAESYVVYADTCLLSSQELQAYNLTFKKIPRDITRL